MPTRSVCACALVCLALLLGGLASPAAADGHHPYFDDGGTLQWYERLADAQAAAQRQHKLIFVEWGRQRCTQCRLLCARILPDPRIRGRLSQLAVGLAAECDPGRGEPAVSALMRRNLPQARTLPFVGFIKPNGEWVTGFAGRTTAGELEPHLARAERARASLYAAPAPAPRTVAKAAPRTAPRRSAARRAPAPTPRCAPPPTPRCAPPPAPREPDCGCEDDGVRDLFGGRAGVCKNGQCGVTAGPPIAPEDLTVPQIRRGDAMARAPATPPRSSPAPSRAAPQRECFPDPKPLPLRRPVASAPSRTPAVAPRASTSLPAPAIVRTRGTAIAAPSAPREPLRVAAWGDPDGGAGATASGSPDAAVVADPMRRGATGTPTRLASTTGSNVKQRALEAAARERWGDVLTIIGSADRESTELRKLARRAHAWAHDRLDLAVRALERDEFNRAISAVRDVSTQMRGYAEADDAERGLEAVELVQDLQYLPHDSAVRRAVQKTAYERLRGTRWARLFQ